MRNDARPIGEEFRDIAEHHHERERAAGREPVEPDRDAVNADQTVDRERLDQPPPAERSDR